MKKEGMKNKVKGPERTWPRNGDVALEMLGVIALCLQGAKALWN